MRYLLCILLFALLPTSAFAQESKLTNFLIVTGVGAKTTEWSLTMYALGKGETEANKVWASASREPVRATVINTAITAGLGYSLVKLRKDHPKLVRVISLGCTIGFGAIAIHNARIVNKVKLK